MPNLDIKSRGLNHTTILLLPKRFKKLHPIFLNIELNRNKLEVNK